MYSSDLEYICWHWFYPTQCINALFRVKLKFLVRICDASHIKTNTRPTFFYLIIIAISENTLSFDYFWLSVSACRSFKAKDYWTISHCFHRIPFCFPVYMHSSHNQRVKTCDIRNNFQISGSRKWSLSWKCDGWIFSDISNINVCYLMFLQLLSPSCFVSAGLYSTEYNSTLKR